MENSNGNAAGGASFKDKARTAWSDVIGDSNPILKISGIIGAFLVVLIGFFGFFSVFNAVLSPLSYMLSIFYIIFGLVLLAVEAAPKWSLSELILHWAPFLGTLIGRGLMVSHHGAILSLRMAGPQSSTIGAQSFTPGERPQPTGFKARVKNIWGKVTEGDPVHIRILGSLAAIGILVVAILGCFNFANSVLNPLTYILTVFYLIFGIILCFVEILPSSGITGWFIERAAFLGTLYGRSLVYIYLGLLYIGGGSQSGASSWAYIVLGIYLVVIAIIFIITGWRVNSARASGSLPNSRV
ncbi:hypothetical protein FOL47_003926 [Perkinsus chesapeaki]|uniref:Uncharacterized protein n=1 Tax=Perkinsus chesapeaki TaxID=330153 RepID=A0A7J6M587_PERCH|nr:hypothetical protein FOL47_003926 [Perkinsus chesapeaki]